MAEIEELAAFVKRARFEDISAHAQDQLKSRVLDSLNGWRLRVRPCDND
jgi:2-methylcitrate dehydratase PrpD